MIGRACRWTQTPFATPLQPKQWNACFWIMFNFWWLRLVNGLEPHLPPFSSQKNKMLVFGLCFNFWWSAGLIDRLKSHLPPLSSPKNEMLIFRLRSTSDDRSMDSNPVRHPSPAKEMKCLFLDYVQLLMIGRAGWWTWTPSTTPLESKKLNAHFWITFNFLW